MRRFLSIVALAGLALSVWNSTVRAEDTAAKIKVLIITGDDVDVHHWKETTAAVRKILVDSGKFDVQVSEDLKPLESADGLEGLQRRGAEPLQSQGPFERRGQAEPLGFRPRRQRFLRAAPGQRVVSHVGRVRQTVRATLGDEASRATGHVATSRPRLPTRSIRSPPV